MNPHIRKEIIRRWYGGQSIRGVARDLKVARKTVKAVLERHQLERQQGAVPTELKAPRARRASLVDPHVETIQELLARYPKITVQRIWEELQPRGYSGGYSILCERVAQLRPGPQTSPTSSNQGQNRTAVSIGGVQLAQWPRVPLAGTLE